MNKAITPIVSVILLIMLTIVASAGAYFFINSEVGELQDSGAIESSPYADNSRLNLVSITGSQALVRNDGSSPVTEIVVLINGETLNYTLDSPIQPGEIRAINYTSQLIGQDLDIKIIYNKGKEITKTSPANINTEDSGFVPSQYCGNSICYYDEDFFSCSQDCSTVCSESSCPYPYRMFQGYIYGNDSSNCGCCGDDYFNDTFYNLTMMCSKGGIIYDADNLYIYDYNSDRENYSSGKGACELMNKAFMQNNASYILIENISTSETAENIIIEDFDNDGYKDLAVVNDLANVFTIHMNNGNKTFSSGVQFSTGSSTRPQDLKSFDFNNDSFLDLAILNYLQASIQIFQNNGSGYFTLNSSYYTNSGPRVITLADFDNDGDLDMAAPSYFSNNITIHMNLGGGVFASKISYITDEKPLSITSGDIDNDGDSDLVVKVSNNVNVLLNNGSGVFNEKYSYATGTGGHGIFLGDFNMDGYLDIATSNHDSWTISILLNNKDGTFGLNVNYDTGWSSSPYRMNIGDIDNDGDLDIIVGTGMNSKIGIFKNNGDGTFASIITYNIGYPIGNNPTDVGLADIDNDGDLDIFAVNNIGAISFFENIGISGSGGPCCEEGDNFTNGTHSCCNGVFKMGSC